MKAIRMTFYLLRDIAVVMATMISVHAEQAASTYPTESSVGQAIMDPVEDALRIIVESPEAFYPNTWPPELFVVPIDLDHAGGTDYLISANFYTNGKQGERWRVYLQGEVGFEYIDGMLNFDIDDAIMSPGLDDIGTRIRRISTGGGKKAVLVETLVSARGIEEQVLKHYNLELESDVAGMNAAMESGERIRPLLRRLNFGMLQERYASQLPRKIVEGSAIHYNNRRKDLPIDYRDPEYAFEFVDSVEDLYTLSEKSSPSGSTRPPSAVPNDPTQVVESRVAKELSPEPSENIRVEKHTNEELRDRQGQADGPELESEVQAHSSGVLRWALAALVIGLIAGLAILLRWAWR